MPPDLSQAARPLAALPIKSCEDADTCSPPPSPDTANHTSGSNGGGLQPTQAAASPASSTSPSDSRAVQVGSGTGAEAGVGTEGTTLSVPPAVNTYRLTPKLRVAFSSVGATDCAYSFREVLLLLKKYLFKTRLFDPSDKLYVNCDSDPLGVALGVSRFHFNDVRTLISKSIIRVHTANGHTPLHGHPPVPDTLRSSSSNGSSLSSDAINDSTCRLSVPPGAASCIPGSVAIASPQPGPSIVCGRERALSGPSNPPPAIAYPDIPDSCSDTETIYSVQGYETEYCRNTEFESSEEEDLMEVNSEVYEEYELPSDDAKDEKEDFTDSDSTIDDVEIAVLAYTLVQDELEEGFWADDSDTDEDSSDEDNDPECVSDRWDCLTCGLKNKPFVRYCGKCWQLRKNWLPDRPKKRKRKPRPKKKNLTKRMASGPSEEQPRSQGTSSWDDHKAGPVSESSADDSSQAAGLIRTSSAYTTTGSNTQDSGFTSSQDLLDSQELPEESVKEPCAEERTLPQPSTSQEASQAEQSSSKDSVRPKILTSRKRKSSSTDDFTDLKRLKGTKEKDEVPFRDPEMLAKEMFNYIASSAGKEWLTSPDGAKFVRSLQPSPLYQESMARLIAEQVSANTPGSTSGISMLCSICCLRPKNASIIHGRLAHQATCYQCARRLLNEGARCPVCRRKIHMVCKQILA